MAAAAREWVIAVPENCREFLHIGQHRSTLAREKSPFTSIGLRKKSSTESEAYQHMVLHPGKWPQLSRELNPGVFLWLKRSCDAALTTKFWEVHFNNVWEAFGKIFWRKLTEKATLWWPASYIPVLTFTDFLVIALHMSARPSLLAELRDSNFTLRASILILMSA